jgi:hypothetical protein
MYNYGFANVLLYLPQKSLTTRFQSYQLAYQLSYEIKAHNLGNNVNAKGNKEEVEMQTPSTTPVFLPRYRKALKLPPSPRWSPS